jgi:hypothetical protein
VFEERGQFLLSSSLPLTFRCLSGRPDREEKKEHRANNQRVDRTTRNRDEAKIKTARKKEIWQALDNEGMGSSTGATSTSTSTNTSTNTSTKEV